MPVSEGVQPRIGVGAFRAFRFRYKFGTQGGAAGAKTLTDIHGRVQKLPDNFEALRCYIVNNVALSEVAGTPTVKLGITGNDDCFVGATAFDDAMHATPGVITALTNEMPVKTAAAVSVLATIASNDLDAGEFDVIVEGYQGS